jgi:hypothetical protein
MKNQIPNAVSIAGFASGIAFMEGAPAWTAIASMLADEVDGKIARSLNAESDFGKELDFGIDLSLMIMAMGNLFGSHIPSLLVVPVQTYLKSNGYRPDFGSVRTYLMIAILLRDLNPKSRRRRKLKWSYDSESMTGFALSIAELNSSI